MKRRLAGIASLLRTIGPGPCILLVFALIITFVLPSGLVQATYLSDTSPAATTVPIVYSLNPTNGPASGGNNVNITGNWLDDAYGVIFGSSSVTRLIMNTGGSMTVTAPPGTGTVYVYVVGPNGISALTPSAQYTYTTAGTSPGAASSTTVLRFQLGGKSFTANGAAGLMDTSPIIKGGRTLLPIRYVTTPLGATLDWKADDKKVTISLNGKVIELWMGKNQAKVNGICTPIDTTDSTVAPILVPPGRTMLPLRFIAEQLGCQVDWDPSTQKVTVTYPKP